MAEEQHSNALNGALARAWASRILFGMNCALFVALLALLIWHPVVLSAPWDGPTLATIALTVAAIVVAAVGIGVALLAVWGYTTLREHAGNIATSAASKAADQAAERKVQELAREWGLTDTSGGEDVATAYTKEG